jgi:hypothetical protein
MTLENRVHGLPLYLLRWPQELGNRGSRVFGTCGERGALVPAAEHSGVALRSPGGPTRPSVLDGARADRRRE